MDLGPGFNKTAWPFDNVHGRFPDKNGEATANGSVQTWGIKTKKDEKGSFKNLYTCFEARNLELENDNSQPSGIPSGAGWHRIGDPAETLINNLSSKPIVFCVARSHGKNRSSYEFSEAITVFWLSSDSVQVTRQGDFHWYLNPYEEDLCTEIWVQNCVPSWNNNWGFNFS